MLTLRHSLRTVGAAWRQNRCARRRSRACRRSAGARPPYTVVLENFPGRSIADRSMSKQRPLPGDSGAKRESQTSCHGRGDAQQAQSNEASRRTPAQRVQTTGPLVKRSSSPRFRLRRTGLQARYRDGLLHRHRPKQPTLRDPSGRGRTGLELPCRSRLSA